MKLKFLLYFIFFSFSLCLNEFNIGILYNLFSSSGLINYSGVQIKESILLIINEINNKSDGLYDNILLNTKLNYILLYSGDLFSTTTIATNKLRRSFNYNGIRACIGPGSDAAIGGRDFI